MLRFAMKSGAACAGRTGAAAIFGLSFLLLAGCSALPDKPSRTVLYDFGPGPLVAAVPAPGVAQALRACAIRASATDSARSDEPAIDAQVIQRPWMPSVGTPSMR